MGWDVLVSVAEHYTGEMCPGKCCRALHGVGFPGKRYGALHGGGLSW